MGNDLYDIVNSSRDYKELYRSLMDIGELSLISDFYHETMSEISYTNDKIPIYFSEYKQKFLIRWGNDLLNNGSLH